ncbi:MULTISPECIES: hypothetical protein [Kordiimonas]|jgi:predicted tellurium resistance membrane protein TerC|uniref:hypothetical protein n=1 Tax=Kordiimonas TaxID=288021 RepID=UPI002579D70F|nr:hypothetical protein [Kordiimonas sp. UBA4487]
MKKVGIFIGLFFLSVLVGEMLSSFVLRHGIVLGWVAFDPESVDEVAVMMAATIMDLGGALLLAAIATPLVLMMRRKRTVKIAAIQVAAMIITPLFIAAALSGDAFVPRKVVGLLLVFLQGFVVAYVAASVWPKRDVNVRQVFE